MDMDKTQLIADLRELSNRVSKRNQISFGLEREERYIDSHIEAYHNENSPLIPPEPKPQKMTEHCPLRPKKAPLIILGIFFMVFLIAAIVVLVPLIQTIHRENIVNSIRDNYGEAYQAWLDSFNYVSTVDELEEGWDAVKTEWHKQGLNVEWEHVEEVINNLHFISAGTVNNALLHSLEGWKDLGVEGLTVLLTLIAFPLVALGIKTKSEISHWCYVIKKCNKYDKELQEMVVYNNTILPKLLKEREELLAEREKINVELRVKYKAEYEEEMAPIREELKKAEAKVEEMAHILPHHYHSNAWRIATIIERGRADTIKEAINIFEADERAEELIMEERNRTEIELRRDEAERMHRQTMEKEARKAAEQAHQDALAQQKMLHDKLEQDARMARRRCGSCANAGSCRAYGSVNCSGFRPR